MPTNDKTQPLVAIRELLEGRVEYVTLTRSVSVRDDVARFTQLGERTDELAMYAGLGYELRTSVTIPGLDLVTIVDTLAQR